MGEDDDAKDEVEAFIREPEHEKKSKGRYPKRVFLIIGSEFCERFSYYGMRTVLVLYVRNFLGFGDDDSTTLFHAFTMLAYFAPLFGGIISDSHWGKYKTIIILSMVYIAGHVFKTLAAIPYIPAREAHIFLSVFGLLLIAFGTGGIKPCVSSFGGDQFKPEQEIYLKQFFSLFYFSINAGALLAKIIMPIFRADVRCYPGEQGSLFEECYALAFGIPGLLMMIATGLLVLGSKYYRKTKPTGSIFVRFCKCVFSAIRNKWKMAKSQRNEKHWVDYADSTPQMKRDTKYVMAVLLIFSPLPFFWALFDQQGSRWTLQALQMDRYWGSYLVKPEQMDTLNPLLILTLIPLFEVTLYPLLRRYKVPFSSIRRMASGLILAGIAFVVTAIVQFEIDKTLTSLPKPEQFGVRILNAMPCEISFQSTNPDFADLLVRPHHLSDTQSNFMDSLQWKTLNLTYEATQNCSSKRNNVVSVEVVPGKIVEVVLSSDPDRNFQAVLATKQPEDGTGEVSFVNIGDRYLVVAFGGSSTITVLPYSRSTGVRFPIGSSTYSVYESVGVNSTVSNTSSPLYEGNVSVGIGGMYSVFLDSFQDKDAITALKFGEAQQVVDVNHFSVNVAWMIPQYIIITVGEIFLSITGLEFAYTQAPPSMKSVVTSFWLLTISLGNVIVIIVTQMKTLERQAHEFLLFACLIGLAAVVFIYIGRGYKPVDEKEFEKDDLEERPQEDHQVAETQKEEFMGTST